MAPWCLINDTPLRSYRGAKKWPVIFRACVEYFLAVNLIAGPLNNLNDVGRSMTSHRTWVMFSLSLQTRTRWRSSTSDLSDGLSIVFIVLYSISIIFIYFSVTNLSSWIKLAFFFLKAEVQKTVVCFTSLKQLLGRYILKTSHLLIFFLNLFPNANAKW